MKQSELDLLVLSAQAGKARAFELLVEAMSPSMMRFAYRLANDKALAQDAVQETWIKLSKTLKGLNDPRAIKSWAFKTLRWKVQDLSRKRAGQVETCLDDEIEDVQVQDGNVDLQLDLLKLIKLLPLVEQQAIYLFYLEQFELKEIAVVLELPEGTVKSRLNRARNRLKEMYEQ